MQTTTPTTRPSIWGREPVMWLAIIQTGLALIAGFGLNLDGQQIALIMAFAAAVLGFVARSQVSPTEKTQGDTTEAA